jgi:hypothetical protein
MKRIKGTQGKGNYLSRTVWRVGRAWCAWGTERPECCSTQGKVRKGLQRGKRKRLVCCSQSRAFLSTAYVVIKK